MDPGTEILGLGNCNPGTQNPKTMTLRTELVTHRLLVLTTDCINFNCETNFDNKELEHVS